MLSLSTNEVSVYAHQCQWQKRFSCTHEGEYSVAWANKDMAVTNYCCGNCIPAFITYIMQNNPTDINILKESKI